MNLELKELSGERTESFKQEIISNMSTKYFDMKLQHERREQVLMN